MKWDSSSQLQAKLPGPQKDVTSFVPVRIRTCDVNFVSNPTNDTKFVCPDCGKVYKWKMTLNRHMKHECNKEPQFQCPMCPMRFKQKGHMVRHASRLHRQ